MLAGTRKFKAAILVLADLASAYLALLATVYLRYGGADFRDYWQRHLLPFSIVFVVWIGVFFIVGLYEFDRVQSRIGLMARCLEALVASLLLSLAVFYLVPDFRITPKTNLAIVLVVFGLLVLGARLALMHVFALPRFRSKMFFLGSAPEAEELCLVLDAAAHLGYTCLGVFPETAEPSTLPKADLIVVSHLLTDLGGWTRVLYQRFFESTAIVDFPSFYEDVRRSVPASALDERWILDNVAKREASIYEHVKRPLEVIGAALLLVPTAVLFPFIALAIVLSDRGPILFRQARVGLGGKPFMIVKFRTMRIDAEKTGAAFAAKDDPRVTRVGRFLRTSRLDELPQLWNILRGDMGFVGPRPERPEFEAELAKTIPLFPARHMVRPGLTGWAQVNAPYAAAAEDHLKKLRLDLYYLKHRSFTLDAAIILKTFYSVLKRQGQ